MSQAHRPPIAIDPVLEDPAVVRRLIERHAPYLPVQRYFSNDAEYRASSGQGAKMIVAPNFRGDWAYDAPLVEGVEPLLHHEGFKGAAARIFESDEVEPYIVYSNLTWQLPFDQGKGHTDVPAFRGIERDRVPIWLLNAMGHSGLFEEERIRIATAVAWFYEGEDGGFTYWADGPDRPPTVHEGKIHNTAIVGDNDLMYHRVRPVGRREAGLLSGMTLDTELRFEGGDAWSVREGATVRAELPFADLRISVSWKAKVYRDAEERRRVRDHVDDLRLEEVFDRFYADLDARGMGFERPRDPLRSGDLVDALAAAYVRMPSIFD